MKTTTAIPDKSREMDEKSWWDLWNTSFRAKDDFDTTSTELFTRTANVINQIARAGDGRMLEIACGSGSLSRKLVYSSYHGLDLSPAAIEVARQASESISLLAGASRPTYEAADFHDWPLPAQPYELVVCVDAISCFRDQQLVLKRIAASLKPGGRLVLTTIHRFVYDRIQRNQNVRLENGPVSHWLTRGELHNLVTRAGLKIERSYTIMPRGNLGILRIANSHRLNTLFGPGVEAVLKRVKESLGLGQYRVIVARKEG
jgi:2-polyprenyl-3-methyl-5-hydroxy-6-metoxy-1,4-benzoquinol methylase